MELIKIDVNGVKVDVKKEDVSKAIETGEISLKTEELINKASENHVIYTKEEHEAFKKNFGGEEYKNGKTAGEEMVIKEAKKTLGLEFEGKELPKLLETYKTKVLEESGKEPNKKIQELEKDNEKLRNNYLTLETEFTGFKSTVQEKETRAKKDTLLMSFLPKTGLKVDSDLTLMALKNKAGIDIDITESGNLLMKNGQVIKDEKTLQPISDVSGFILKELTSLALITTAEGGSGQDKEPGGATESGYDKFVKEMKSNEIEEGSLKFHEEMNKRMKAGTLKI